MADNQRNNFEHDFSERLKELDAQIRIPGIPDAQAVFDRAETEKTKNNILKVKYIGTVAAAAVVVIMLVSVPAIRRMSMDSSPKSSEEAAMFSMQSNEAEIALTDESSPETAEEYSEDVTSAMNSGSAVKPNPPTGGSGDMLTVPLGINSISDVLGNYFDSSDSDSEIKRTESNSVESFTEYISKKRSVDVGIESDSVSVMLNDDSGEREILSAFWVEGVYQSSYESEGIYVINLVSYVTEEDYESGNYMPLIGDAIKGTYSLPEEDVYVPDAITDALFNISININIETGEYEIYASLV